MLNNLSIKMKMIVVLGLSSIITVLVGLTGYWGVATLKQKIEEVNTNNLASIQAILTMEESLKSVALAERALINSQMMSDSSLRQAQYAYIDSAFKRAKDSRDVYEPLLKGADELKNWNELKLVWDTWSQDSQRVIDISKNINALLNSGIGADSPQILQLYSQIYDAYLVSRKSFLPIENIMEKIGEQNEKEAREAHLSAESVYGLIIIFLILATFIGEIISVVMGTTITRSISGTTIKMQQLMAKAENGDLTVKGEVTSRDEMGQIMGSLNQFVEKIREMIRNIYETMNKLNKASENLLHLASNIAASSEETNAQTTTVSSSVEEISSSIRNTAVNLEGTSENMNMIAASIEEMTATIRNLASASEETSTGVKQVSGMVEQISGSINNVSGSAKEVSASVNSVATAVKEINASLNEISKNCERSIHITTDADAKAKDTNEIIEKLNNLSMQIGKIVNVINDIADQTNMLALNAAIEAAGAGEAGKGFTVVANEVKELAKQTAEATEEISQQIQTMQAGMSGAVQSVETITAVIKEITQITNTIAAAVTEQSSVTGEISNSVVKAAEKVNVITREIEDVAATSRSVAASLAESSKGVNEIARSAAEISSTSVGVAQNTEKASGRIKEVTRVSQEVAKTANDISKSVSEINEASEDVATGATETSNSAKELAESALHLEALIKQFKI
jgi:methyl-accepting chemotaxis protein